MRRNACMRMSKGRVVTTQRRFTDNQSSQVAGSSAAFLFVLVEPSAAVVMLLCGVLRTALSVSFGTVVQTVILLLQNSRVQASLPPGAEDEIILIEHLPGRRVHLQDFFWTDVEDAPPWVDPNHGLTFYETKTVRHTVTIYSPFEDKDNYDPTHPRTDTGKPKCTTCIEPTPTLDEDDDENIGVLIEEDPGPRYWLLTVLRAGETVPAKIELKLARLYRTAFLRQQQRHLGLLQTNSRTRRVAENSAIIATKSEIFTDKEEIFENSAAPIKLPARANSKSQTSMRLTNPAKMIDISKFKNIDKPIEMDVSLSTQNLNLINEDALISSESPMSKVKLMDFDDNKMRQLNEEYFQDEVSLNLSSLMRNVEIPSSSPLTGKASDNDAKSTSGSHHSELRLRDYSAGETVQVKMQNTSVTEGGATRLIYSVHLGGKPVPAETAARDMALLSPQEVALELGAPVLIQSEPYLKETRPLALSRKRDAWLLIGAASAGFILLAFILMGLIFAIKRKRTHSAIAASPSRSILKKQQGYVSTITGLDNTVFTSSEVEAKADGASQRQTPANLSRTPVTPDSPDSHELSSDIEELQKGPAREPSTWDPSEKIRLGHRRILRSNAVETPRTSDSMDVIVDYLELPESLENIYTKQGEEATASPHSYLSMPSCKQFPSMRNVEPLSKILEPVMVKHLDIDSPELTRHDTDHIDDYTRNEMPDKFFSRTSSTIQDPGVVGPIVWDLRKQSLPLEEIVGGTNTSETDAYPSYVVPDGRVGRARKRLHELLEDSFSLFGSRDQRFDVQPSTTRSASVAYAPDVYSIRSETKGRSANISPLSSPTTEVISRPCTALPQKHLEGNLVENGHSLPAQSRGGWASRPLSAGPFHRPNLPEIDTNRVLTDCQLSSQDPAVPLIVSIKKELEKFSSQ